MGGTMGRKVILVIIMILLIPLMFCGHVYASQSDTKGSSKDDTKKEETKVEKKVKAYTETFEDMLDVDLKATLSEEERSTVRKTYMKLYKRSFDGFFLNFKERFSVIITKFQLETKACGSLLVIAFLITSFIQGMNNKVLVGSTMHLSEGKISARYRYYDGHLEESRMVGKLVRIAMILEGLMLVAIIFKSDGILFRKLFLLEMRDVLWRAVAYSCIRLLISFLAMFIPYILAYLVALLWTVIVDLALRRTDEHGTTFHAKALDLMDNKIILGILGIFSGVVFLIINYSSWFIYLEAAGMFD